MKLPQVRAGDVSSCVLGMRGWCGTSPARTTRLLGNEVAVGACRGRKRLRSRHAWLVWYVPGMHRKIIG